MIKVLGRSTSGNVQKILFFLEETDTAYEREDYGRQFENTQTPQYKAMNPASKVPTVIDGDTIMWESNTILRYLAETVAPGLTGATAAECTAVECWMDFLLAAVNPGYMAAFKGARQTAGERPPEYDAQVRDLASQLAIIDGHLAGREYMALDKLTIADIALAPILRRCCDFEIGRAAMPELERWLDSMGKRASFQAATGLKPAAATS